MPKVYADIINDCETLVQDAGVDPSGSANQVFATAELDSFMPEGLLAVSRASPWEKKLTKTTTASSYDITLTTGDKWRLLIGSGYKGTGIQKIEYLVDKNPRQFRGLTRFADIITLEVDNRPSSAVSAYLYMNKVHLLQQVLTTVDTEGTVKTATAVGDVTVVVEALGTLTIEEMTTVAITGDSTVYYVISTATIATNEATLSIWPPIAQVNAIGAVVTLSVTGSTLDLALEGFLARWLAAQACISKATKSYAQVNTAITTIAAAATAVAAIAARITAATGDVTTAKTKAVKAATAIADANTEFDKIVAATVGPTVLATSALASGLSLVNSIPIGGGAAEYMGQAASQIGLAQGHALAGQTYLQESSAYHANAASYYNSATTELRASSEKANEAVANLRLVASRLQVSQGGLRYEQWGRTELARVEDDMRAYGGFPSSVRYPRN